jgi:hypothetical protein
MVVLWGRAVSYERGTPVLWEDGGFPTDQVMERWLESATTQSHMKRELDQHFSGNEVYYTACF